MAVAAAVAVAGSEASDRISDRGSNRGRDRAAGGCRDRAPAAFESFTRLDESFEPQSHRVHRAAQRVF
jgi:hypothetical protein